MRHGKKSKILSIGHKKNQEFRQSGKKKSRILHKGHGKIANFVDWAC